VSRELCCGGGITSIEQIKKIFDLGGKVIYEREVF
jgi:imidazole glycerol phosphate synthase subunit HisF